MKKITAAFVLLIFVTMMVLWSSKSFGQFVITKTPFATTGVPIPLRFAYTNNGLWVDSTVRFLKYATVDTNVVLGIDVDGYLTKRTKSNAATVDSSLYATVTRLADTSAVLRGLIPAGTDTTSLSDRINARVKYTDTAAMLSPYALLVEIPSITGKVNYTDTATMLAPYLRKADTTAMLAPYATEANLADTAAVLRGLIPTGTDTTSLSNRIDARVKYTDTAAMLSPYATEAQVALKVNYTDTATMLAPYLRDADTASLSTRINLKVDSIRRQVGTQQVQMKINGTWENAYTDSVGGGGGGSTDTASLSARINRATLRNGIVLKGGNIYFQGDSYTSGSGASSGAKRWTTLLCNYVGATEFNFGVAGACLMRQIPVNYQGPTSMMDRLSDIPTKGLNDKLLVIAYGLNDLGQTAAAYTTSAFQLTYDSVLTNAYSKGWSGANVLLIPPYFISTAGYTAYATITGNAAPDRARHLAFVEATRASAQKWQTLYFDMFADQLQNDTTLLDVDGIHANDNGHKFIATNAVYNLNQPASAMTSVASFSCSSITFSSVTNITNTGTTWTATSGTGYGQTGLSSTNLASGTAGRIVYDGNSEFAVYGFNTANAQTGFAGMEAGMIFTNANQIYAVDNGSLSGILGTANDSYLYGIYRDGSVLKLQYSSDDGTTWVDIYTYSFSSAATLYVVCDISGSSAIGYLRNPQICTSSGTVLVDNPYSIPYTNANGVGYSQALSFMYGNIASTLEVPNIITTGTINAGEYSYSVTSAGTLSPDLNTHYIFSGTTSTWTLPAASTSAGKKVFIEKNRGSGNITVNTTASANEIWNTSAVNTLAVTPGSVVYFFCDGTYWNAQVHQ